MRIELPDSYTVVDRARRTAVARPAGEADDAVSTALLAAFSDQHLELVRAVDLRPTPAAGRATRAVVGKVRLAFDVEPDEDAVILLEQDGFFSWQVPTEPSHGPTARGRTPSATEGRTPSRTVHFEFDVQPVAPQRRSAAQTQRSLLGLVVGPVRAYVLKFAAKVLAGKAMTFLERDVRRGLVLIESAAIGDWRDVDDLSDLRVPKDRASRWLLLVHGTFSSTRGSFGGLAATQPGQEFLDAAVAQYDAVIGFDHPTLSLDPLENATDLLGRLAAADLEVPPTIDVVCFSRGALVARSLIEQLLPVAEWKAHVDRVVFVGAANRGTKLAEPENWQQFVDLYTNLAAAGARALSVVGAPVVGTVIDGLVQGVGAFVKYLVSYAVDGAGVPGLAAMEPDGSFVKRINETQPGQPSPGTPWYVVSTDFDVSFFEQGQTPGEFPGRLVRLLADGLVDQLMEADNDLVVDTASMSAVDPGVGGFIKDSLAFGKNSRVYHTKYFVQPEVCHALMDWFDLHSSTDRPTPPPVSPGSVVAAELPRAVDTDIVRVPEDELVTAVRARLRTSKPRFAVIERQHAGGTYRYPYARRELELQLQGERGERRVVDALNVGEWDAAPTEDVTTGRSTPAGRRAAAAATPRVLLDDDRPVAVAAAAPPPPTPLAAIARAKPRRSVARNGGGGPRRARKPPKRARRARATAEAHLRANMPAEVKVGSVVTVTCRLSPDDIAPTAGATATGTVTVERERKITLRVVAKANVDVVGSDTEEVMLPAAGEVVDKEFQVRPTHAGTCEVWVELRQGEPTLLTLRLRAVARPTAPDSRRRTSARATVPTSTATDIDDIQWFRIVEREKGRGAIYEYEISASDLKLLARFESPLLKNRERYVNNVYREIEQRWLSSKQDSKDFEEELRAYGGQLFDELFPPELQRLLWKHRKKLRHLMVLSTERFIPWELVHLKQPGEALPDETIFLGQVGIVRWLYNSFPQPELHARRERVRVCCPKYADPSYDLPQTALEERFLVTEMHAKPVPATAAAVRKVLRTRGELDLFHFGGHGRADTNDIANAAILLAGRREGGVYIDASVTATLVKQHARLGEKNGQGPLVVLNACQVGRLGTQMSSLGGFADAFLSRGAAAFVSSLWSVGDAPARTFVETFYGALLDKKTITEAAVAARKAARAAGDATWLAYVVYAHPAAKLI